MDVIAALDTKMKENPEAFDLKGHPNMVKMLGQAWRPKLDCFFFRVPHVDFSEAELQNITKRQLLAETI